MGGREVGGLANQLAAHMGVHAARHRPRRAGSGTRRAIATHEGLKAVQMFEAIARGEIKALWVMGTNPAVSLPRCRRRARGAEEARTVRRLRERGLQRHRQRRAACAAAGAGLGREVRHRDQFGTADFAAARLPAVAGRGQARLVDVSRGRAAAGLRRGVRLPVGGGRISRTRRALGVRERRRRAISISAG